MNIYRRIPLIVLSLLALSAGAQPQIWGYIYGAQEQSPGSPFPNGSLFRVDLDGLAPEFLFPFDTTGIRWPLGGMLHAANGKLYGAVPSGSATIPEPSSYIWEYDPVVDSMQIKYRFQNVPFSETVAEAASRLTEGYQGRFFGIGRWSTASDPMFGSSLPIYSYDTNTNTIQVESSVPGYYFATFGQWYTKYLNGGVTALPDGRLMLAESRSRVLSGAIGIADPATGSYDQSFLFDQFNAPDGHDPNGDWVEVDGIYYSTTQRGGYGFESIDIFQENGYGTIYSYDVASNAYIKLHEFTDPLTGFKPFLGMVKGTDGYLYGLAWGGTRANGGVYYPGTIYSYDPEDDLFQHRADLGLTPLGDAVVGTGTSCQLLAASNGRIYGSFAKGLFEYDPVSDTLRYASGLNAGYGRQGASQLIELCRKPNYKPRPTSSFIVCNGSYFAYDLRNVNAAPNGVVWRRNGIVVPDQTSQRLEFAAISAADAGVWSCTLSNECGVTEPPPITITVNPGTGFTPTITGPEVLCGPNGTIVLTGNTNGGTWPDGTSTPTLTVTEPGLYQVHQTNTCGSTFSNIIEVERQPIPVAPEITDAYDQAFPVDSIVLCTEFPVPLRGNGPGWWYDIPVGTWQAPDGHPDNGSTSSSISADVYGDYYITLTNACGTDTSARIRVVPPAPWPQAEVIITDQLGTPADLLVCSGDSVVVTVNYPDPIYALYSDESGYIANGNTFTIGDSLHYFITASGPCPGQSSEPLAFQLQIDEAWPPPAIILPDDMAVLVGCDQDSTYLISQYANAVWSWVDTEGQSQQDTSDQLLVDWSIGGNGVYTLMNYNGCGESQTDAIQVQGVAAPEVLFSEPVDSLCLDAPAFVLSPGIPANGQYTGAGVAGASFVPALAGAGDHIITYSYSDGECTGFARDTIHVDLCLSIPPGSGQDGVYLFPNPNDGRFELVIDRPFNHGWIRIYSADGRTTVEGLPLQVGRNTMIDQHLSPGVYFAWMRMDEAVKVIRFEVL